MTALITPTAVEVGRRFRVSGVEPVPDTAGCPLDPEDAVVTFREINGVLRATYVAVRGKRMRGAKTAGTYNRAGYGVDANGNIEPHYRRGMPPPWVQQVVDQAIEHQAAGRGLILPTDPGVAERLAEMQALFDLQWKRMGEATDRWRAEDPEARALTSPDLGDLLKWLMDKADQDAVGEVIPVTVPQLNNGVPTLVVFAVPRSAIPDGGELTFDAASSIALGPALVLTALELTNAAEALALQACRDRGEHTWDRPSKGQPERDLTAMETRCTCCRTVRIQLFDHDGNRVGTRYRYPDGAYRNGST